MINKLTDLTDKISNNEPFAFSRWGDGEFSNINKQTGQNCDGNIYYGELGDALLGIVSKKQDYNMGVQTLIGWSVMQSQKFDQNWGDADVMHKASEQNKLQPLINCLIDQHVVYIGNESFNKLSFINNIIEIPYKNVWLQYDAILQILKESIDDTYKVYCFSAGMAANVFIDELWKYSQTNAYLDVGSVFDPHVGRKTRSYHRNIKQLKI